MTNSAILASGLRRTIFIAIIIITDRDETSQIYFSLFVKEMS